MCKRRLAGDRTQQSIFGRKKRGETEGRKEGPQAAGFTEQ